MNTTPNVRFLFDRNKRASKTSNGSLEIEFCYKRQRLRLPTGVCLKIDQWREGKVIKRLDANILNEKLNEMFNRATEASLRFAKDDSMEFSELRYTNLTEDAKEKEPEIDAINWIEERINGRQIKESTRTQHLVMLRCLRASKLFKTFKDFTPINLKKWDDMLKKQVKTQSSVHGYHKRLKPYLIEAVEFGLLEDTPYKTFHVERGKSTSTKYITAAERDIIESLKLKGGEDKARDMFIFACYTGLAYSDIVKITRDDVREEAGKFFIRDYRQKTGSQYNLTLLPKAMQILEKYNFNMKLMSDQKCNLYLKIVASRADIKIPLTLHMGRHTFATWALSSGVPIEVVSKMLAHADIKTTQIYAKVLQSEVSRGFDILEKL